MKKDVKESTTVKINKDTFKLLIMYKALLERVRGESYTFNTTIKFATIVADWYTSKHYKLTNNNINEHTKKLFNKIKIKDDDKRIESLLEELAIYGFELKKK